GFRSLTRLLPLGAVDRQASPDDPSPSLHPHYRASPLLRDGPPLCPASLLGPSRFQPLGVLASTNDRRPHSATGRPRARGDRFTRSAQEPGPRSRHLNAGHRLANRQAPARLVPGPQSIPGFDATYCLSTRHQWFARARLRDPHLPRATARRFPRRSPPRLLTAAARGGLRPPPARRPRRATRPTGPAPP